MERFQRKTAKFPIRPFLYSFFVVIFLPEFANAGSLGVLNNTFFSTGVVACAQSSASCDGSAAVPGTTATLNYSSFGVDTYGVLGGFAQASVTPGVVTGTAPAYANVAGGSYFVDDFTFTGTDTCGGIACAATGAGTIRMQFLVSGTDTQTGPVADSFGGVCMDVNSGNNLNFCDVTSPGFGVTPGVLAYSPPLAITFGQAATFSVGFFAFEHILSFTDPNVSFTADFSHTVTLAGFVVDDADGNPLGSFSVTSGSGTAYPDTAVPEPSTLLTVGTVLSLAAVWGRFRRSCANGCRVISRSRLF